MKEQSNKAVPGKDTEEKTSVGGNYNSGVTSDDPATKEAIERKASLLESQPPSHKDSRQKNESKEDSAGSTKGSTGV